MRKALFVLLFVLCSSVHSMASSTLTLTGVGAGNIGDNGAAYTYPYEFAINVNGQVTHAALMCDDFNDDIWIGESWNVTVHRFTDIMNGKGQMSTAAGKAGVVGNGNLTATQVAYADAAYIFLHAGLVNGPSSRDVAANEAVWELFANTPNFSDQAAVDSILNGAKTANTALTLAGAETEYGNVLFYTPKCTPAGSSNCGQIPSSDSAYRPQEFIGVPEPGTLPLTATGLCLLTFVAFRRRNVGNNR